MNVLDAITDIALIVLLGSALLFIGFYASRSPWQATRQGQLLMAQSIATALLAGHFLVGVFFHFHGFWLEQAILVCLLAVTWVGMLSGLLLAQKEARPVSRRHGTGLVPPEDIETTLQTRKRRAL